MSDLYLFRLQDQRAGHYFALIDSASIKESLSLTMSLVELLSDFIRDDALCFINLEDFRDELGEEQGVKI